mmetsp:Transcript_45291/g.107633  ORF Transcript_45291/g.107633 Transcript_45291/m.107633 type:complete len:280 (+) Transcript_45291:302-1141(+)
MASDQLATPRDKCPKKPPPERSLPREAMSPGMALLAQELDPWLPEDGLPAGLGSACLSVLPGLRLNCAWSRAFRSTILGCALGTFGPAAASPEAMASNSSLSAGAACHAACLDLLEDWPGRVRLLASSACCSLHSASSRRHCSNSASNCTACLRLQAATSSEASSSSRSAAASAPSCAARSSCAGLARGVALRVCCCSSTSMRRRSLSSAWRAIRRASCSSASSRSQRLRASSSSWSLHFNASRPWTRRRSAASSFSAEAASAASAARRALSAITSFSL